MITILRCSKPVLLQLLALEPGAQAALCSRAGGQPVLARFSIYSGDELRFLACGKCVKAYVAMCTSIESEPQRHGR